LLALLTPTLNTQTSFAQEVVPPTPGPRAARPLHRAGGLEGGRAARGPRHSLTLGAKPAERWALNAHGGAA